MSKAVLISIRPKWVEKIANGEKTIEVRKTKPKLETPFKCYIYCTLPKYPHEDFIATDYPMPQFYGGGKVVGEFTCDQIIDAWWDYVPDAITREVTGGNLEALDGIGMTDEELFSYVGDSMRGHCYGWHISDLRIYDTPRELSEFTPACRYKNDDGSCPSRRVACSYQKYDYNPDGSINLVECGRTLERPPQSWCYVDDVQAK